MINNCSCFEHASTCVHIYKLQVYAVANPGGPRRAGPPSPKVRAYILHCLASLTRRTSFPFQSLAPRPNPGSATGTLSPYIYVLFLLGQVHLCTETNRLAEVLEAAFLHRTRIDHCHAEWKATLQGHTTFTKDDPFQSELRFYAFTFTALVLFLTTRSALSPGSINSKIPQDLLGHHVFWQ